MFQKFVRNVEKFFRNLGPTSKEEGSVAQIEDQEQDIFGPPIKFSSNFLYLISDLEIFHPGIKKFSPNLMYRNFRLGPISLTEKKLQ